LNTMMPQKNTIAVALIVKNEAHNLKACLDTVRDFADEIVILDSGSTDATEKVARTYTDKYYDNPIWEGFGPHRRIAQTHVNSDFLFWIDADERVTPLLKQSIQDVLAQPDEKTIYSVSRLSWFFGKFIRHSGWHPDRVVRLYRTKDTQYNDAMVHEKVEVPQDMHIKKLKGDLLHFTYQDLNHYLVKSARYAKAWADQREKQGKKSSIQKGLSHGLAQFIRIYFLKAGFLDGKQGLLLALLSMQSTFAKYADLWIRTTAKGPDRKDYIPDTTPDTTTDTTTDKPGQNFLSKDE